MLRATSVFDFDSNKKVAPNYVDEFTADDGLFQTEGAHVAQSWVCLSSSFADDGGGGSALIS